MNQEIEEFQQQQGRAAAPFNFTLPSLVPVDKGGFIIKDTGQRETLAGGMVRSPESDKIDYTLALDGPMFERYAVHLTKGAKVYAPRNWMKCAEGTADDKAKTLERYYRSAARHMVQYLRGDKDEDHAAAVIFNLNGAEYLKEHM